MLWLHISMGRCHRSVLSHILGGSILLYLVFREVPNQHFQCSEFFPANFHLKM